MSKKMKCLKCGRRAFDISELPKEKIFVELKCPQCKEFVKIPCDVTSLMDASMSLIMKGGEPYGKEEQQADIKICGNKSVV